MSEDGRLGLRAITMQQPFAAAMAAGVGLYTRRGKSVKFSSSSQSGCGEWIAIHCGSNDEHIKNSSLMSSMRDLWPECPTVEELRDGQRCILGLARFVDGDIDARKPPASTDPFLSRYDCTKRVAWKAEEARRCSRPLPYPKGQLQVWQVRAGGFTNGDKDGDSLLALRDAAGLDSAEEKVLVSDKRNKDLKLDTAASSEGLGCAVHHRREETENSDESLSRKRQKKSQERAENDKDVSAHPSSPPAQLLPTKKFTEMILETVGHLRKACTYEDVRDSMKLRYQDYHAYGASGWPSHISTNMRLLIKKGKLEQVGDVEPRKGSGGLARLPE